MSETGHAPHGEHHGIEHGVMTGVGLLDTGLGLAEGALSSPIGHAAHHFLHEHAPKLMPGLGGFIGPLGMLAGAGELAAGNQELMHGDANGALPVAQGLASIVGGTASTLGGLSALAPTAGASVLGMSSAAGAATAPFSLAGAGSLLTTASGAVAAGSLAGVAGAAGAGMMVGKGMAAASDSNATRTGLWGNDPDTGRPNSAMDWAAGKSLAANQALGLKSDGSSILGSAAGAVTSLGLGAISGIGGTVQAGYNTVEGAIGGWLGGLSKNVGGWPTGH